VRVAFEQWRPLGIDQPAEVRPRPALFDQCNGRQRVDDVAEGAGFEDQNRRRIDDFRFQISNWEWPAGAARLRFNLKSEISDLKSPIFPKPTGQRGAVAGQPR
jgi:hypothetical protein